MTAYAARETMLSGLRVPPFLTAIFEWFANPQRLLPSVLPTESTAVTSDGVDLSNALQSPFVPGGSRSAETRSREVYHRRLLCSASDSIALLLDSARSALSRLQDSTLEANGAALDRTALREATAACSALGAVVRLAAAGIAVRAAYVLSEQRCELLLKRGEEYISFECDGDGDIYVVRRTLDNDLDTWFIGDADPEDRSWPETIERLRPWLQPRQWQ